MVERKFRLTILVPVLRDHSAQSVGDALIGAFTKLPSRLRRRTLTWDQGNEMFHHERIEEHTGLNIYFADPHSPWQRGANENINGLLRQYFRLVFCLRVGPDLGCVRTEIAEFREVGSTARSGTSSRVSGRFGWIGYGWPRLKRVAAKQASLPGPSG